MSMPWTTVWRTAGALAASSFLIAAPAAVAAGPAPTASLVDPAGRLPYGKTEGNATLKLKVDGLDADHLAMPKEKLVRDIADLDPTTPPEVGKIGLNELPKGSATRFFILTLPVKKLLANDTQTRNLRFVLDGAGDQTLPYTLTNTAIGTFSWTLTANANVVIAPGDPIEISAVVGPVAATGLKVLFVGLSDTASKGPMSGGNLFLCPTRTRCDPNTRIDLPANSPNKVYVYGTEGIGQFTGSLTIACNEKPGGDAVPMTVYSSSAGRKAFGIVWIVLGVLLSWLLAVYLKNRLNRDQMLLPVLALRETRARLEAELQLKNTTGIPTVNTSQELKTLYTSLSDAELQIHGLPRGVQVPWASPIAASPAEFQSYLVGIGNWLNVLAVIVAGLEKASALYVKGNQANNTAVAAAFTTIDDLVTGTTAPPIDQVTQGVNAALKTLRTVAGGGARLAGQPDDVGAPSERSLQVDINRLSYAVWALVAVLTIVVGAYVLIYSPNGTAYGTIGDYFTSFLWGLGLPSGATLLQSSTSSTSVTSTFAVVR